MVCTALLAGGREVRQIEEASGPKTESRPISRKRRTDPSSRSFSPIIKLLFLEPPTHNLWVRNIWSLTKHDHNFWCRYPFSKIFAPLESPRPQLFNGTKIIKNGHLHRNVWNIFADDDFGTGLLFYS